MKAQDLKNSIFHLAMKGKLVPQNPDDVPAKELLDQIQKEKEQLIKDKKIKRNSKESVIFRDNGHFYEKVGKNGDPVCIDDEIPFDIPDTWEWVRLGNIIQINPRNKIDDDLNVSFIPMTLIDDGYNNSYSTEVRKWGEVKSGYTHFAENDIGIAKITPCFENRKSVIFDSLKNGFGAGTTELHILRPFSETLERLYLLWFSKTSYFIDYGVKSFTGTAGQQRVGKKYVENCLFPLPPLEEQKRIVKKNEELMPYVEEFGDAEEKLKDLNETFPEKIKVSILQEAVQGKLVPQDPYDVPAKELLDQIQKEKEQLIKDKKIKRNSKESVIFRDNGHFYEKVGKKGEPVCIDDELPFDIPNTWEWVRLGSIIQINPRNKIDDDLNVSFIPMTLIDDGYNNSHSAENRKWGEVKSGYTHFAENDLGIAKITPCFENRKSVIFDSLKNGFGAGTTELHILRPFNGTLERIYLLWFSKTSYFVDNGVKSFTGTAGQQRVGKKYVENCLFPLPPLEEQKRIVKKIEVLLEICKNLIP